MIFIPFYAIDSIDNISDKKVKASKLAEMIVLLYLSIRFFCGKNVPIFILDNSSPIKLDIFLKEFNERYIILQKDNYYYDSNVKLYIKKFENHEGNFLKECQKACREFYKYAYVNNLLALKQAAGTLGPDDLASINSWLEEK